MTLSDAAPDDYAAMLPPPRCADEHAAADAER